MREYTPEKAFSLALQRVNGIFGVFLGQNVEPHPFTDICADGGYRAVEPMAVFRKHALEDRAVFRGQFPRHLNGPLGRSYRPDGTPDVGDGRTCVVGDAGRSRGLNQGVICGGDGFRRRDCPVHHESCQLRPPDPLDRSRQPLENGRDPMYACSGPRDEQVDQRAGLPLFRRVFELFHERL